MSDLKNITRLARLQVALELEVANLEEELKQKQAELRAVAEKDLPEAMDIAGLSSFKMSDGRQVTIERVYHASIPEARAEEAFKWLKRHKHDSIIKNEIIIGFGRGEETIANKLFRFLKKEYPESNLRGKKAVHAQTLRAFVREMMESGEDIPHEVFGIYVRDVAKIGAAKS